MNLGRRGKGPAGTPSRSRAHWAKVTNNGLIVALGVNHYTSQENPEGATWGRNHVGVGGADLNSTWGEGRGRGWSLASELLPEPLSTD